jgi:SAM-dependent methyltransferase
MNVEAHPRLSSNHRKHTAANPLQRVLIGRFHQKILSEILALAPESFLDAGCGEGFVARRILDTASNIDLTGCDVSEGALEIAARVNPEARFVTGSVVALPFPDRSFDVVGCFEVLEHLPGDVPRKALSELARVARRAVVLSVPHEPMFCIANAARGKNLEVRPRGSDPDHKQFWTRSAFGRLVGEQFNVQTLHGAFPWTICVATTLRG